jgi:hypothetical protein
MTTAEGMELLMKEPGERTAAEAEQAKVLERLSQKRKPPFTQAALDNWLDDVIAPIEIGDLIPPPPALGPWKGFH